MSAHIEDEELDPREIEEAADETLTSEEAPEVPAQAKELTEWDTPPSSAGSAAPKLPMEDEVTAAEELVTDGLDEADRHQRMAAVDPDLEP